MSRDPAVTSSAPATSTSTHRAAPPRPARSPLQLAALALALLAFFLFLYPFRGFHFPVGPDAPVYLWWSRVGGHGGLSSIGARAGLPALVLMVSGATGLSVSATLAALGAALGTAVGLAAAGLVLAAAGEDEPGATDGGGGTRSGGAMPAALLAGLLAGTFAVHLAEGYFANLAFVALFLAAACCLALARRPATAGATVLLAAGALAHPLFFLVGAGVLGLAALQALRGHAAGTTFARSEAGRVAVAVLGGAAAGTGLLGAVVAGGHAVRADTSKDAFLRRAGLGSQLRHDYLDRLARHWARYWLPITVPLAAVASWRARGFLGRLLRAWGVVLVLGVAGALVTGLAPADRFITFGYVLPVGAALGLVALGRRLVRRSRALAVGVVLVLLAAMLGGALVTWLRARPFIEIPEIRAVERASPSAAEVQPGTPLVFLVDSGEATVSFLATRAGNVIRAGLPPDRVRDVYLYVGSPRHYLAGEPTLVGDEEHDALSRLYLRDLREAAGGRPLAFVLEPFNRKGFAGALRAGSGTEVAPGVLVLGGSPRAGTVTSRPVEPASSWFLVLAGLLAFALLGVVGLGWSRAATGALTPAAALAPAFGAGTLLLAGVALDVLGIGLAGAAPPVAAATLALAGFAVASRTRRAHPDRDPDRERESLLGTGAQGKPSPQPTAEVEE
jgi:hypothetical protein